MRFVLRSRAGAPGIRFVSLVLLAVASLATVSVSGAAADPGQPAVSCRSYFVAHEASPPRTQFTLTFDEAVEIARFGLGWHPMARNYLEGDIALLESHLERAGRVILALLDPSGVLLAPTDRSRFVSLIREASPQLYNEVWLIESTNDGPVARLMAAARESIVQFRLALRNPRRLLARGRALQAASVSAPLEALAVWLRMRTQEQVDLGFSENDSLQFAVRQIREELDIRERYALEGARPTLLLMAVFHGLDPHSFYLAPDAAERRLTERRGTYRGMGLRFLDTPVGVRVARVSVDSPAERAGIHVGDLIVGVGRERFTVNQVEALINALTCDPDVPALTLRLRRDGIEREVTVNREQVAPQPHVERELHRGMDGRDYAVIRVLDFTEGVADRARAFVRELAPQVVGIMIDLRGNAGGSVEEATALAVDFMLTPSQPVLQLAGIRTTTFGSGPEHEPVYTGPLVIMVDSESASGAEIVAGALQALGRAVVVGRPTFGKGTGQAVLSSPQMPGPGMVRISEGYFYLPNGRSPQRIGIQPDVELPARSGTVVEREVDLPGALPESRIDPLLAHMPPRMWDQQILEQRLLRRFGSDGPVGARGAGSGDPERTMALGVLEELAGLARR